MSDLISRADAIRESVWLGINGNYYEVVSVDDLKKLPSVELQGKCDGCFYAESLDGNVATCEFCARNYPDRYSAKMEGEEE